jgi:hypothetical protein
MFTEIFFGNSSVFTLDWRNKGVVDNVWFFIEVNLKSLDMISLLPITYVKLQRCKKYTSQVLNKFYYKL